MAEELEALKRACAAFGACLSARGWGDAPIGAIDDDAIEAAMRAALSATPSPSTDTLEQTVADIGDDELIRRVIAGLVRRPRTTRARTEPLWSRVGKRFALGSTYSMQLCRRFNFNPDERVLP